MSQGFVRGTGHVPVTAGSGITVTAQLVELGPLTADWTQSGVFDINSSGKIKGTALQASGLTGATSTVRWVGGTASGAPVSGTFAVGDYVIAQNGAIWVCTTAGSPGTWTQVGSGGSTHDILSATHTDSLAGAVVDGDVIIGNVTPKWSRLAVSVPAANIVNTLGVVNGELRPSWKSLMDSTAPVTQAFGDAAAAGTGVLLARITHVHGMPANPVTAHEAAGDPHTVYVLESAHASPTYDAGHHLKNLIIDADADTYVNVEVTADDDIIESASAGTIRARLSASGLQLANGTDLDIYTNAFTTKVVNWDAATGHMHISDQGSAAADANNILKLGGTFDGSTAQQVIQAAPNFTLTGNQNATGRSLSLLAGYFGTGFTQSGVQSLAFLQATINNTTVNDLRNVDSLLVLGASALVVDRYGLRVRNATGTGAVTNQYGLYIEDMAKGGTLNRAIQSLGGISTHLGAFRIGSNTVPTNVTNGDLTPTRLIVPDAAILHSAVVQLGGPVVIPSDGTLLFSDNTNYVGLQAPATPQTENYIYQLPDDDPANGQVLAVKSIAGSPTISTEWITPSAGGGANVGTTTIDFGAFPGASDTSVAVTGQASIVSGSVVHAWLRPEATADHTADEHIVETLRIEAGNISAGVGFTIYALNTNSLVERLDPRADYQPGASSAREKGPSRGGGYGSDNHNKGTRIYGQWTVQWQWA